MKLRQIIIILAAIAILAGGKLISNMLAEPKEKPAKTSGPNVATVFTQKVKTSEVPIYVESTGLLKALDRMELYSEVQGVMLPDGGRFKPGNQFKKGQVLIAIRADDQQAQLVAQRSSFERLLSSVMPDLKVDFSADFPVWQNYLQNLNVEAAIQELPVVNAENLKMFLTGRNIYSEYYSLKNKEILLSKYQIHAAYDGELVEATVDPGTVIRPGQRLGVFIRPGVYELEAAMSAATAARLKTGQGVELKRDGFSEKNWVGKISRVNKAIDAQSQMSQFFVRVESNDLSDGMFMQARVKASSESDAIELPRTAIFDDNQVFIVDEGILVQVEVMPLHFNEGTVVVQGLTNDMAVLSKIPPGAFPGMAAVVYQENSAE